MNYNTTTFNFSDAVVRVHRPELTDQERGRRMKAIYNASAELLKNVELRKKKGIENDGKN